jgi:hypothetical protein
MLPLCRGELEVHVPLPEGAIDITQSTKGDRAASGAQSRAAAVKARGGAEVAGKQGTVKKHSFADVWHGLGASPIDKDMDIIQVSLSSLRPLSPDDVTSEGGAWEAANLFLCETSLLEADDFCIVLAGASLLCVSLALNRSRESAATNLSPR